MHSFEMDHLVFGDEVDESKVVICLEGELATFKEFNYLLDDKVEKEGDVAFEEEVVVVLEQGVTLFLLLLIVAEDEVALSIFILAYIGIRVVLAIERG
jgi:hypothetical protein